jgi:thiosulfate dehydrogenase
MFRHAIRSVRPSCLLFTALAFGCGASSKEYTAKSTAPTPPQSTYPVGDQPRAAGAATPASQPAAASAVEVTLCDGQTKVDVPAGSSGTSISSALMAEWLKKNPDANWEAEERERHTLQPAAENKELVGQIQGTTYGRVTQQDVDLWKAETERVALAGSQVFHSAEQLGSTVGVSCDMCHPHAANTHPETYPKFQTQLGRVVLLRDMINWCIEHPVRGKPLASDDPRMRGLEAYILAQRKGKVLEYGKH